MNTRPGFRIAYGTLALLGSCAGARPVRGGGGGQKRKSKRRSFVATKLSPAKRAEAMLYRSVDGKWYDRLLYDELPRQASPQLF